MSVIQKNPEICGGEARVRNTRHTVAGLIQWQRLGPTDQWILEHHPDLTEADLEAAWLHDRQHSEEIDRAIREDEEA
jgi:uncharacterized protein (DUF433 family)